MIQKIKELKEKEPIINPLKFFKQCLEETKESKLIRQSAANYSGLYYPEDWEIIWED